MALLAALVIALVRGMVVERGEPPPSLPEGSAAASEEAAAVVEEPTSHAGLPSWFVPMPGSAAEVRVLRDDGRTRTGTIELSTGAALEEVMEFYRRRLDGAGFVVEQGAIRPGVAALLTARRPDGSEVTLAAVAGTAVIRFDEPALPTGGEEARKQQSDGARAEQPKRGESEP